MTLPGESFEAHGLVALDRDGFPAVIEGRLVPPPASHVLDFLVRHYVLDEDAALHLPTSLSLISADPGTVAMIFDAELPRCDRCELDGRGPREARYDGPASPRPGAPWGYLCPDCFASNAPPVLGMGRAQYLITRNEIPDDVREAFFRARDFWAEQGNEPSPYHPFEPEEPDEDL